MTYSFRIERNRT